MSTHPAPLPQLRMYCPSLANVPALQSPEGYVIRHFRQGDQAGWNQLMDLVFKRAAGTTNFDVEMLVDYPFRPERVWLALTTAGELVATASAWFVPGLGTDCGTLHWVGCHPGHAGKKLGHWVSVAALHQLRADGRHAAALNTDDFRLAAIKVYLRLGFLPMLTHESHRWRWPRVLETIEWPERFERILTGPFFPVEPTVRDNWALDREVQYRRRWLPGRAPGLVAGAGGSDALAGESLYAASHLGRAGVEPAAIAAGTAAPLTFWYEFGADELPPGATVRFLVAGPEALGAAPQSREPTAPGYVVLDGPAAVAPEGFGFRVMRSGARSGDRVRLRVADFRAPLLAGKHRIIVELNCHDGSPARRLPVPAVFEVLAQAPAALEVWLPGTLGGRQPPVATVRVRDAAGNRVPLEGQVTLQTPFSLIHGAMTNGLARLVVTDCPPAPLQVTATAPGLIPGTFGSNPAVPRPGEFDLYFGDLHAHDFLSPAASRPEEVYFRAQEEQRLDFLAIPVETHGYLDNDKWTIAKYCAEAFLREGQFVTFPSFEWQHSHYGHKTVGFLAGDQPYLPVDDGRYDHPAKLYEALRGSDAFVIGHGPANPQDTAAAAACCAAIEADVECGLELRLAPGGADGLLPAALRQRGLRMGFVAGSNTHQGRPGAGGLTGVWAAGLTRQALFAAIRARRVYALSGARIVLWFTVNGSPMGAALPLTEARELVADVWAPSPLARVQFLADGNLWEELAVAGTEQHLRRTVRAATPGWYACRVILADGQQAVSSPVWVG